MLDFEERARPVGTIGRWLMASAVALALGGCWADEVGCLEQRLGEVPLEAPVEDGARLTVCQNDVCDEQPVERFSSGSWSGRALSYGVIVHEVPDGTVAVELNSEGGLTFAPGDVYTLDLRSTDGATLAQGSWRVTDYARQGGCVSPVGVDAL